MAIVTGRRRWLLLPVAVFASLLILIHLDFAPRASEILDHVPLPPIPGLTRPPEGTHAAQYEPIDNHPISLAIADADRRWLEYDTNRSRTFVETVNRYRREYGRHPPPGFPVWYRFAREKNAYNVDDFTQAMGDLRPFWSVEPKTIRALAAHMWENKDDGVGTVHVRAGKVARIDCPVKVMQWRCDTMGKVIETFSEHLPDMDITANLLDQPRLVVPWEDLQAALKKEEETRVLAPEALDEFTANMTDILNLDVEPDKDNSTREDPGWFPAHGKPYMDLAKTACPPESHARRNEDPASAETTWKSGGVVTNFNLSSDLCTVGPELAEAHGFLFTASTVLASKRLVPVFSECKVSVNNDILFPANMYWRHDERYEYDPWFDVKWHKKAEDLVWRGVTSGGVQLEGNWPRMHRQRLVQMLNATVQEPATVTVLAEDPEVSGEYLPYESYAPAALLRNHTDVGFVEAWGCVPNCSFYDSVFEMLPSIHLNEHFRHKYLVDVDGHSFSGRWRAFMLSKALGIKATIFREWHDSRLFAWRHFVPMDNRFGDIYTLLTYFMGVGKLEDTRHGEAFVPRHDAEARRLAEQGHEWAQKVMRKEDIEVSPYLLDDGPSADRLHLDIHVPTAARVRPDH